MVWNVGLIGAGTIGTAHAAAIGKLGGRARLAAVADTNEDAARRIAEAAGARVYKSHREMLENEPLDVAAVCLPHNLHLGVGLDVLDRGVHLFVEKPMALSTADCRRLIETADRRKKRILVGQTHQYHANFRKAREMIRKETIGAVRLIFDEISSYYKYEMRKAWFLDPKSAGGGPLFNTTPHQIDHLLYLADSRVASVRASAEKLRPGVDLDSDAFAFVEFENGIRAFVGTFSGTRIEEPAALTCKVFGAAGTLGIKAGSGQVVWAHADQREALPCPNETDPFELEWTELMDAVESNRAAATDGVYGHNVVAVLEAMVRSAQLGKEVQPEWLG